MKGLKLFLIVCLAPLIFHDAIANDSDNGVRATARRATQTSQGTGRQTATNTPKTKSRTTASSSSSRNNIVSTRERTSVGRTSVDAGRTKQTATKKPTAARTTTATSQRVTPTSTTRTAIRNTRDTNISRATQNLRTSTATNSNKSGKISTSRYAGSATVARNTTKNTSQDALRQEIISKDYKKCREVYYDCMDEFCANKDNQLKRCACSSRINEFDKTKQSLAETEDKLLDFSQRLLTINLDKEDATAISQATDGENAYYNSKDTSASKKILNEIASKLNTSFSTSNFNSNLSSLSWSLNEDAAFDNVDSLAGASTTLKTGSALYTAALPVCREMANEICSNEELSMVESGYQMAIEQDCNIVRKSYESQTDSAREKIREGAALLDMSRLDNYQTRNSDDILTCKNKMLTMLTDSAICGTDLGQCLDMTGRYIDPTTGEAFLTVDLAGLNDLITRPIENKTWTNMPGNEKFVSFLNSKKEFLEPAMKNCENIADYVWDSFVEDALSQIKLAQERKLETIRQSCTTLTAQCLTDATKTIQDFDARALSIFGISADKTVNTMCNDIKSACVTLLNQGGSSDWESGITQISVTKTDETIITTCREVGRNCIIQACKSLSGNFGLCEDIETSINRKNILNRTACWNEVVECVASAGTDKTKQIMTDVYGKTDVTGTSGDFYNTVYKYPTRTLERSNSSNCTIMSMSTTGSNQQCIYDICSNCGTHGQPDCYTCRLAERIWGNCEFPETTFLKQESDHNQILIPADDSSSTLLSWFAVNTGTETANNSCQDNTCGPGYFAQKQGNTIICTSTDNMDNANQMCPLEHQIFINYAIKNCCGSNTDPGFTEFVTDSFGNCCQSNSKINISGTDICIPTESKTPFAMTFSTSGTNETIDKVSYEANSNYYIICSGTIEAEPNKITCTDGTWILVANGLYTTPISDDISNYYQYIDENGSHYCEYKDTEWKDTTNNATCSSTPGTDDNKKTYGWHIKYD